MQDTALHTFISDIERDLLFYIIVNLQEEKITMGEVKNLAKEFLQLLPVASKAELVEKLNMLGKSYKEARKVYAKYLDLYEEEKRERLLGMIRMYMQQGEFEKAVQVAKGGR